MMMRTQSCVVSEVVELVMFEGESSERGEETHYNQCQDHHQSPGDQHVCETVVTGVGGRRGGWTLIWRRWQWFIIILHHSTTVWCHFSRLVLIIFFFVKAFFNLQSPKLNSSSDLICVALPILRHWEERSESERGTMMSGVQPSLSSLLCPTDQWTLRTHN